MCVYIWILMVLSRLKPGIGFNIYIYIILDKLPTIPLISTVWFRHVDIHSGRQEFNPKRTAFAILLNFTGEA